MHRFYLPPDQCQGSPLILSGGEAHHALKVVRLRRGEAAIVLDGVGCEFRCRLAEADRRTVRLEVLEKRTLPPLPWRVTLFQSVIKAKAMDWVMQKATELGVHQIVPVLSQRGLARIEPDDLESKTNKWQAVALEAIKQCGLVWLPRIDPPATVPDLTANRTGWDLILLAGLGQTAHHPRVILERYAAEHGKKPENVAVWIGPEGDFTPEETDRIRAAGAQAVSLGPRILRSETAALYALSILSYELQA